MLKGGVKKAGLIGSCVETSRPSYERARKIS